MHVSEDGGTVIVGSAEHALVRPYGALTVAMSLIATSSCVAPPLLALAIEHEASEIPEASLAVTLPGLIAVAVGTAAVLAFRFVQTLLVDGTVVAVRFDRDRSLVELTTRRILGLSRTQIPFAAVRALRMFRGKVDDDSTKAMPVIVLADGSTIALPEQLDIRELTLLKLLTGLRRS